MKYYRILGAFVAFSTGIFLMQPALALANPPVPEQGVVNGQEVGNGGDDYALEFIAVGRQVMQALRTGCSVGVPSLSLESFNSIIEATRVTSTESQLNCLDSEGNVVRDATACNYPGDIHSHGRIELNRGKWRAIRGNSNLQISLAYHEYRSLLRQRETQYNDSSRLLACLSAQAGRPMASSGVLRIRFTLPFEGEVLTESRARMWMGFESGHREEVQFSRQYQDGVYNFTASMEKTPAQVENDTFFLTYMTQFNSSHWCLKITYQERTLYDHCGNKGDTSSSWIAGRLRLNQPSS